MWRVWGRGEVNTELAERDHFQDEGVDARIILKCICTKWVWGMDWIDLAVYSYR
jgi:hypothetical protein